MWVNVCFLNGFWNTQIYLLEKFVRTIKNKICKYVTSVPKNVYINKLADIINKPNNAYNSIIKMKSVDIKSCTYIDFVAENNDKDSIFEVGDYERISKHKHFFAKGHTPKKFCD